MEKIITNSVLDVKATASLSKEIAKDLTTEHEEKDMKEILNENNSAAGNDRGRSTQDNNARVR